MVEVQPEPRESLDEVEITALTPGRVEIGGRILVVEYPPDRAEIEELEQKFNKASWTSEQARIYTKIMLDFLMLPIIKDGFDFDPDGKPRDPQEAHAERRAWEHEISGKEKLQLDLNMLGGGRFIEALNMFDTIKTLITIPGIQDQFAGPGGEVPEVLRQYAEKTGEINLVALKEAYKRASIQEKLEVIEIMRQLMKNRVRGLIDAYQAKAA